MRECYLDLSENNGIFSDTPFITVPLKPKSDQKYERKRRKCLILTISQLYLKEEIRKSLFSKKPQINQKVFKNKNMDYLFIIDQSKLFTVSKTLHVITFLVPLITLFLDLVGHD